MTVFPRRLNASNDTADSRDVTLGLRAAQSMACTQTLPFKLEVFWAIGAQLSASTSALTKRVENRIKTVDFHLVDHFEENTESTRGKTAFGCKPS